MAFGLGVFSLPLVASRPAYPAGPYVEVDIVLLNLYRTAKMCGIICVTEITKAAYWTIQAEQDRIGSGMQPRRPAANHNPFLLSLRANPPRRAGWPKRVPSYASASSR